jgi:type IV pilus assembly protein PilM
VFYACFDLNREHTEGLVVLELFRKTKPEMVGIDISNVSVKMLELGRAGNGLRVEGYAVVPLPEGAVVDKKIEKVEQVADAIRALVSRSKSKLKQAAVSVVDPQVITKLVQVDAGLSEHEMGMQIALEADKLPYPLKDISYDYVILGTSNKSADMMDVLLVATRTENVDTRVDAVRGAGLEVKVVDVQSYAMERACQLVVEQLPDRGVDRTIAVIDIGATMINLTVLHDMNTIFTRAEVFGGEQLTKEIQRRYCLTYSEAGLAKKRGTLPDDYVDEVLEPFKQSAVLQVRRALQYFFSASAHNSVHHILLAGGTVAISGLAEAIEQQLGIPTTIANPFSAMTVGNNVDLDALTKDAPAMMICCGLAMRSFDNDAN